ncbi:MAG: hypothetical protein ACLGIJ_07060 [Candidatus Limnocylindria bacterium]
MAGYGIVARIDGVRPRFAALDGRIADADPWPAFPGAAGRRGLIAPDAAPLAPADPGPTLPERIERARELWGQITFFLFDPNSWR